MLAANDLRTTIRRAAVCCAIAVPRHHLTKSNQEGLSRLHLISAGPAMTTNPTGCTLYLGMLGQGQSAFDGRMPYKIIARTQGVNWLVSVLGGFSK
jgi:hypothetical protein